MAVWSVLVRWASLGTAAGVILAVVHDSVFSFVIFEGNSMKPTIENNDIGICDKTTPFLDIRRGDIVIASSPKQPSVQICKRVVALAGDELSYNQDKESDYEEDMKFKNSRFIPRGHVWVEGDEKRVSFDSRRYGPIPMGLIKARVIGTVFPFRNATIFAREPPNEVCDSDK